MQVKNAVTTDPAVAIWEEILPNGLDALGGECVSSSPAITTAVHTTEQEAPSMHTSTRRPIVMPLILVALVVALIVAGFALAASGATPDTRHSPIVKTRTVQCVEQIHANGNATINKCHTVTPAKAKLGGVFDCKRKPCIPPAATTTRPQTVRVPRWVTHNCATEDSVNCHWDAQFDGNGRGHSYLVMQFPGRAHMVCVKYDDRRYAAHHDYCA